MRLHELRPPEGARKAAKRKGRGMSSGLGKTSGRGQKGQKSRSGSGIRRGFEGGQMPYFQRLPKRGFTNIFKQKWNIVNVSDLNVFDEGTAVTPEKLVEAGLIRNLRDPLKVLGNGEIDRKLEIQANRFSKQAQEKIEAAGGKAEVI
ncbi:MAG: 50S ribosomal protein L15 [Dethiobacteria bacterium]|nr:50S ribosomal protein L15 [Bacillota bacterium]MDW7729446.1 50S ribosomal protein L15 [Bacillota bacterium]